MKIMPHRYQPFILIQRVDFTVLGFPMHNIKTDSRVLILIIFTRDINNHQPREQPGGRWEWTVYRWPPCCSWQLCLPLLLTRWRAAVLLQLPPPLRSWWRLRGPSTAGWSTPLSGTPSTRNNLSRYLGGVGLIRQIMSIWITGVWDNLPTTVWSEEPAPVSEHHQGGVLHHIQK